MSMLHPVLADYRRTYLSYVRALRQTHLISIAASYSLRDFPNKLPKELRGPTSELFLKLGEAILAAVKGSKKGKPGKNRGVPVEIPAPSDVPPAAPMDISQPKDLEAGIFANSAFELVLAMDAQSKPKEGLSGFGEHFRVLARQQAMAMVFAHLDAFFADTLRVICCARPDLLRTNKQVTWSMVLQFQNMDAFVQSITDQFIYEFGWRTIADRLNFLEEKVGLQLDIPAKDLELLRIFEQRRHLVVHNGGIVSQRFIEQAKDTTAVLGQAIEVSVEELDQLFEVAKLLGSDLCRNVSKEFLGADDLDLTQVWVRGPSLQ